MGTCISAAAHPSTFGTSRDVVRRRPGPLRRRAGPGAPLSGQPRAKRLALIGALAVVTLGLWLPTYAWAEQGHEPWAWVAGFTIGACALSVPRAGVIVAVGLAGMAGIGAVMFDGSVVENIGYALGSGALIWLSGLLLVWLLRLVWAAEAGRDAESDLVLAHERLRMSRELHDVLGHRLGIIALKAELALISPPPIRLALLRRAGKSAK